MHLDSFANDVPDTSRTYRTNPLLLVYPASVVKRRQLIVETSSSLPPLLVNDPRFIWAISALPEQYTQADAYEQWASEPRVSRDRLSIWALALETGVVLPSLDVADFVRRFDSWHRFNWDEAAIYHEATRDYPFVPMFQPGSCHATRVAWKIIGAWKPRRVFINLCQPIIRRAWPS